MTSFLFFQWNLPLKLTPAFLNVETTEFFPSKAAIKITSAAIHMCLLKKAKVKTLAKFTKIKFTG